mmetsp:Transcript_11125/g.15463  ORF Transcript_11125/g.15463 Transcript_11125/m.15463 type:complete len:90 (+) Transcript_11125:116-385(+)
MCYVLFSSFVEKKKESGREKEKERERERERESFLHCFFIVMISRPLSSSIRLLVLCCPTLNSSLLVHSNLCLQLSYYSIFYTELFPVLL